MTMSDPIADMLTRIRNGQRAGMESVESPASKLRLRVLAVLKREGYIHGFARRQLRPGISLIRIELKYHGELPVIRELTRVSKPGRRVYSGLASLPQVHSGLGIVILSTPAGILSGREARNQRVGGEILCRVF